MSRDIRKNDLSIPRSFKYLKKPHRIEKGDLHAASVIWSHGSNEDIFHQVSIEIFTLIMNNWTPDSNRNSRIVKKEFTCNLTDKGFTIILRAMESLDILRWDILLIRFFATTHNGGSSASTPQVQMSKLGKFMGW